MTRVANQTGEEMRGIMLLLGMVLCIAAAAKASADSLDVRVLNDPSGFVRKAGDQSKSIVSIQSDFVQKKHLSVFSEDVVSRGRFLYKKEHRLRWEYTAPFKYVMVLNNDKFSINDNIKTSVFDVNSNAMFLEINDIMISCLKGTILTDSVRFKASFFETATTYIVKLAPLSGKMKGFLQRIEVFFEKSDLSLSQLHLVEVSGDYSNILFRNRKINTTIPDETFILK
jgi:outer membrane lipoprotein-sorting protein